MKGEETVQAPRAPDLRLVNDLSPATPPPREVVLADVSEYARRGAMSVIDDENEAESIGQEAALDALIRPTGGV